MGLNWEKDKRNRQYHEGKYLEKTLEWQIKSKFAAYRNKEFWIGPHHAERYYPGKSKPPENGLCFNARDGMFEIRKKGALQARISWKQSWQRLAWWAQQNGIEV